MENRNKEMVIILNNGFGKLEQMSYLLIILITPYPIFELFFRFLDVPGPT
jgi:hypothetical protein